MKTEIENKGEPQPDSVDSEKKSPTGTLRGKLLWILNARLGQLVKEGVDIPLDSETDSVLLSAIEKEDGFLKITLWASMVNLSQEDLEDFLQKRGETIDTLEVFKTG